jgi:myosin heavy subunit
MSILQSTSQLANATDHLFFENVNKALEGLTDSDLKRFVVKAHPKDKKTQFTIRHFAGTVTYHSPRDVSTTWLGKNNDDVPGDLTSVIRTSRDAALVALFPDKANVSATPQRRQSIIRKVSIADGFTSSMSSLCGNLGNSSCSFIRCIKPNPLLLPITFDDHYTVEQIRALGLVQVCSVMKVGLPVRISFADFKKALGPLVAEAEAMFQGQSEEVLISSLLFAFDIPKDVYQLGRTRLFFRSSQLENLDAILTTDFVASRSRILAKLQESLAARKKCEDSLVSLQSHIEDLKRQIASRRSDSMAQASVLITLKTNISDLNRKVVEANLSIADVLEHLNTCQSFVTDLVAYGQPIADRAGEAYAPILAKIAKAEDKLESISMLWGLTEQKNDVIQAFLDDDSVTALSARCSDHSEEISTIELEVAAIQEFYDVVSLEANRCNVGRVMELFDECEHKIGITQFHLKKHGIALDDIKRAVKTANSRVEDMNLSILDVKKFSQQAQAASAFIADICQKTRVAIDDLRDKVAKDEEERLRLEVETREREAAERARREEEERQAALAAQAELV